LDAATIIAELEAARDRLNSAIAALRGTRRNTGRGKVTTSTRGRKGSRRMLTAVRKRISDAQKRRWAKQKKAS